MTYGLEYSTFLKFGDSKLEPNLNTNNNNNCVLKIKFLQKYKSDHNPTKNK